MFCLLCVRSAYTDTNTLSETQIQWYNNHYVVIVWNMDAQNAIWLRTKIHLFFILSISSPTTNNAKESF